MLTSKILTEIMGKLSEISGYTGKAAINMKKHLRPHFHPCEREAGQCPRHASLSGVTQACNQF